MASPAKPKKGRKAEPDDRVRTLEQLLATREIVVCCGSGGVGKTTTAAAAAAMAATHLGGKVLVVTVDPAGAWPRPSASSSSATPRPGSPVEAFAAAGVEPRGELWAAMLDTKQSWDDLVSRHAPNDTVRRQILENSLYQNISGRFVQSHDYIAMERLYEIHCSGTYDLIVVDTPPTRNAIDFLEAPARMGEFFSSKLLRWLTAPSKSRVMTLASKPFYTVADRILGSQFLEDIAEFFSLFQTMAPGFVERADAVSRILSDRRTTFLVVSTLEAAPLHEAEYFIEALDERKLHLGALVLNKVLPAYLRRSTTTGVAKRLCADADELAASVAGVGDPADVARVLRTVGESFLNYQVVAKREAEQRASLARSPEVVAAVPYFDADIADLTGLLALGEQIWRCTAVTACLGLSGVLKRRREMADGHAVTVLPSQLRRGRRGDRGGARQGVGARGVGHQLAAGLRVDPHRDQGLPSAHLEHLAGGPQVAGRGLAHEVDGEVAGDGQVLGPDPRDHRHVGHGVGQGHEHRPRDGAARSELALAVRLHHLDPVVVGPGHPERQHRTRERRGQEGIELGRVHRHHGPDPRTSGGARAAPYHRPVASLAEIVRKQSRLSAAETVHLQRLVASWNMLADFCFSDLLLFVPIGEIHPGGAAVGDEFLLVGHVRPSTTQTLYRHDMVGDLVSEDDRPLVARSLRREEIIEGEITVSAIRERIRVQCIPVRYDGRTIAVLSRESTPTVGRSPGELERTYVDIFNRFARMIAGGEFPYALDDSVSKESPRGWATAWWCSIGPCAWSTPRPTPSRRCTAWACTPTPRACASASSASRTSRCAMPSRWPSPSPRRWSGARSSSCCGASPCSTPRASPARWCSSATSPRSASGTACCCRRTPPSGRSTTG